MPTVLRTGGFRFFFFSNEGTEPPHVHVDSGDGYAKFWLDPVELAASVGFNARELRHVRLLVIAHRERFREAWNEHFGA
ncbi:MAG TPA: DUF4160 domain-containing protein [Polyangia bacterium]